MKTAHRRAHRRIWTALGLLLPTILIVAFYLKDQAPVAAPAVQLEAPSKGGDR